MAIDSESFRSATITFTDEGGESGGISAAAASAGAGAGGGGGGGKGKGGKGSKGGKGRSKKGGGGGLAGWMTGGGGGGGSGGKQTPEQRLAALKKKRRTGTVRAIHICSPLASITRVECHAKMPVRFRCSDCMQLLFEPNGMSGNRLLTKT